MALPSKDIVEFERKFEEQSQLVNSGEDVRVLKKAMASFVVLKHVQLLRVQDLHDERLLTLHREHPFLQQIFQLQWTPACLHSARTIALALSESVSSMQRFSSPMLDPQSAVSLAEQPPRLLHTLATRLTCLELHFDGGADLDDRMQQLSPAFRAVFTAAVNLEAVHIGFPSHRPLSLPLNAIFHDIHWKRLVAFGVQGWKLDADEIMTIARRYRDRLRGLRLRDILLTEGSTWKDVLSFLRNEMTRLDWVSLRRIGYAKHFDEASANVGVEVPDDPPDGLSSDSNSDDEEHEDEMYHTAFDRNEDTVSSGSDSDEHDADAEIVHSDDEHDPQAYRMDFPPLRSPKTLTHIWCSCNGKDSIEDLRDDGAFIDNTKRKSWEQWVLRRCPEHSPRS